MDRLNISSRNCIRGNIPKQIKTAIVAIMLGALLGFSLANFSAQTLVMIGAGGLLFVFFIQPAKLLLGYLAAFPLLDQLIPFFTTEASRLRLGPQILFRGGLTVLLAYYWLINQRNPLSFKVARPMSMLFLLLAMSTLSSGIMVRLGLVGLTKLAFWMLLLLTVADMVAREKIKLETIYRCIILSMLIFVASLLIFEFFLGIKSQLGRYNIGEATGVFDPHSVGLCLSMGFIVVLTSAIKQRSKLFLLLLLLFSVLIVISIMKTYVRTGYTTLASALLMLNLMVWRYGKNEDTRRQKPILCMALLAIMGIVTVYTLTHIKPLEERFTDLSDTEKAGAGRLVMYKAALKTYACYSMSRKIFGGGLGAAFAYYPGRFLTAHNDYLGILLSGGLVGIGLHLWLLIRVWRQVKLTAQNSYWPLIIADTAIILYVVSAMTSEAMHYASVMSYFSFIVGGALGYYKRLEDRDTISQNIGRD